MLDIIKEETIGEYKHIHYSNGAVVKQSINAVTGLQLEPVLEPTNTERIMQAMTDSELRDFEIQQGQELLAQKMVDIELAVLGGNEV